MSTKIQWCDETWNPTTGCTKVSPGCANCYIERTPAFRIAGRKFDRLAHIPLRLHADRLETPLHWKKPRRVFVNSLSDLFHDDVPDSYIDQVFAVMALASRHTFQILTKRPERMRQYLVMESPDGDRCDFVAAAANELMTDRDGRISVTFLKRESWPLPNVWLGVSVENQHFADERIPLLLQTPAAVRFISAEPLLGPVDLTRLALGTHKTGWGMRRIEQDALNGWENHWRISGPSVTPKESWNGHGRLDWVIVGGESGPGARPFYVDWARSIVEQCRPAGVPVFVKQLGANAHIPDEWNGKFTTDITLHDRKGGDPAEWPADLRVREYPA